MKRAFAMLAGVGLILGMGCGNYDLRLSKTLEEMRYRKRLDDNLIPVPTKGRLEQLAIFVRPPLDLQGPTQTFGMTVLEPGRFDVENSFIDQDKQESLHLLARVKQPKSPTTKKSATTAAEAARGDFRTEVVEIVKSVYGADVELNQFKDETKKHGNHSNTFKTKTIDLAAKKVQVYFYGDKTKPYEVALIFEYPTGEHAALNPRISLSLEAFAVGEAAKKAFAGGGDMEAGEEGDGGGGSGAAPPI